MSLLLTLLIGHWLMPVESGVLGWLLPGTEPDCSGLNICMVSDQPLDEPALPVEFVPSSRGLFQVRIRKHAVADEQMLRYFSTGFFIMTVDYTLPSFVSRALGYPLLVIRTGKYPVDTEPGYYVIQF